MTDHATLSEHRTGRPIHFIHATVVTVDARLGVVEDGEVLVVGDRIEAVGHQLAAPPGALEIDARGAILMPGMIDTHRHLWQSAFRGVAADWTLSEYVGHVIMQWTQHVAPSDVWAANRVGVIEALDAGVTTVMDWCHAALTPEHADAAVDAHAGLPARIRFGYGNAAAMDLGWVRRDLCRIRDSRTWADGELLTLQAAIDVFPADGVAETLHWVREQGLPISSHAGLFGMLGDEQIEFLADNALLGPDITLVHAASLSDDSYRRIADSGAKLSISAESELNAGQGYPPTNKAREFGIPLSLSMDTVLWWSGDMFAAMRASLNADRGRAHQLSQRAGEMLQTNAWRAADVVRAATLGGAEVLGLDRVTGSITPGKRADLVLLSTQGPVMSRVLHPHGHLVFQAGRGDVDAVLVDGVVVKSDGRLVGIDVDGAISALSRSADALIARIGDAEWTAVTAGTTSPEPA